MASVCNPADVSCLDSYNFSSLDGLHRGPLSHEEPLNYSSNGDGDCLNLLETGFYHSDLGQINVCGEDCERPPAKRLKMGLSETLYKWQQEHGRGFRGPHAPHHKCQNGGFGQWLRRGGAATWERTHYISTQRYSRSSNTSAPTLTGLAAIQHVHIPAHICFILFSWLYTCVYMYRLILFRSFFFFFTMTSVMSNCTDLNLDFSRVNTAIYFPVLNFWKCHKRVYVRILWKTDLAYLGRGQGVFLSHDDWLWAQPLLCGSISVTQLSLRLNGIYDHFVSFRTILSTRTQKKFSPGRFSAMLADCKNKPTNNWKWF